MTDLQAVFSRLNAYVSQRMWEDQIPGLVLALTNREETLYVSAHGYADLAAGTPVKLGTLFEIGSISQSFTSTALLQLHDAGQIDLHTPVRDYLPWFDVKSKYEPICIHHLLSQLDYHEVEHPAIMLPPRQRNDDYVRLPVPNEILVPEVY